MQSVLDIINNRSKGFRQNTYCKENEKFMDESKLQRELKLIYIKNWNKKRYLNTSASSPKKTKRIYGDKINKMWEW